MLVRGILIHWWERRKAGRGNSWAIRYMHLLPQVSTMSLDKRLLPLLIMHEEICCVDQICCHWAVTVNMHLESFTIIKSLGVALMLRPWEITCRCLTAGTREEVRFTIYLLGRFPRSGHRGVSYQWNQAKVTFTNILKRIRDLIQMMSSILSLCLFIPTPKEKSEPGKNSGNSWTAIKILTSLASPDLGTRKRECQDSY